MLFIDTEMIKYGVKKTMISIEVVVIIGIICLSVGFILGVSVEEVISENQIKKMRRQMGLDENTGEFKGGDDYDYFFK